MKKYIFLVMLGGFCSCSTPTQQIYQWRGKERMGSYPDKELLMAILHCFNLEGEKIWHTSFGEERMASFPGSRSAPTIVDHLIYVGSGMGNLYCNS